MALTNPIRVGVIGAGSFGTAIASLLAHNVEVLIYSRKEALVQQINQTHQNFNILFPDHVFATSNLQLMAGTCRVLFPIVASAHFRTVIQQIAPFLTPEHILIHGTKGLDIADVDEAIPFSARQVQTMSQIILEETNCKRVGCLSGPNLATEILLGQPTATVVASEYKEVIDIGKKILSSSKFHAYGSHDVLGAEWAGALKNVVAIGSGLLKGMGYGKNLQAVLITKGLQEMIEFGKAVGASEQAFYSMAGVGDLFATTTSKKSRNYTFGYRIGQGEQVEDVIASSAELAEGRRTIKICRQLATYYHLQVPVFEALYHIIIEKASTLSIVNTLIEYRQL